MARIDKSLEQFKRLRKTIRQRERRAIARGEQIERAILPGLKEIREGKISSISALRRAQEQYQNLVIETTPIAESAPDRKRKRTETPAPALEPIVIPEGPKQKKSTRRMSKRKTNELLESGVKKGFFTAGDAKLIQNAMDAFPDLRFRNESDIRFFLDYVSYRTETEKSLKMYYKLQIFAKSFAKAQKADYQTFDQLKKDFEKYMADQAANLARADSLDKNGLSGGRFHDLWNKAMKRKK